MLIEKVEAKTILEFRHENLRKGLPFEQSKYPNDNDTISAHFACFDASSKLIGCASLFFEKYIHLQEKDAYRLRGMAVDFKYRKQGIGKALLLKCFEYAKSNNAQIIWCNARTPAIGFYKSLGFESVGNEYELPNIGPHYLMYKNL